MLSELRLINYKKFVWEKISLEPITVFVGPNGSGKSTIASALRTIAAIMRLGMKSAFPEGLFSFDRIISHTPGKFGYDHAPIGLGLSGQTDGFGFDYDIIFLCRNSVAEVCYQGLKIEGRTFGFRHSQGIHPDIGLPTEQGSPPGEHSHETESWFANAEETVPDPLHEAFSQGMLKKIRRLMQGLTTYQFSPSSARMGHDQYDGSGRQPVLKTDSSNLAQIVQYFQEERRELLARLKDQMIRYADSIADIGVATYGEKVFLNLSEQGEERGTFPVWGPLISDGHWAFAAFACLASCETMPSVAFFEEPESHLHPHRLPLVHELFRTMSEREGNPCQIMLSTHSPHFLDLFKETPDSVILLNQGTCRRLTEIENHEKMLSLCPLGDLWHSNVLRWGNP